MGGRTTLPRRPSRRALRPWPWPNPNPNPNPASRFLIEDTPSYRVLSMHAPYRGHSAVDRHTPSQDKRIVVGTGSGIKHLRRAPVACAHGRYQYNFGRQRLPPARYPAPSSPLLALALRSKLATPEGPPVRLVFALGTEVPIRQPASALCASRQGTWSSWLFVTLIRCCMKLSRYPF